MGLQTRCHGRLGRRTSEGKAHLERDHLSFRGDFRVTVPFAAVRRVSATDTTLRVEGPPGVLSLELGRAAAQWAEKIKVPKSRIEKLGVPADARVSVLGLDDPAFDGELRTRTDDVSSRLRKATDVVFLHVRKRGDLARFGRCRAALADDGTLWAVYRKGEASLSRNDVFGAGHAAGLVDIKIVSFSDTHTALKFVIPVADRTRD